LFAIFAILFLAPPKLKAGDYINKGNIKLLLGFFKKAGIKELFIIMNYIFISKQQKRLLPVKKII
jgi:hypothetical protein